VKVLPPSKAGAENETNAYPFPRAADPIVGASGTVAGVTEFDGADSRLLPTELVAWAVNLYDAPFDRPATMIGLDVPEAEAPPGDAVTV